MNIPIYDKCATLMIARLIGKMIANGLNDLYKDN